MQKEEQMFGRKENNHKLNQIRRGRTAYLEGGVNIQEEEHIFGRRRKYLDGEANFWEDEQQPEV